MRAIDYSEHKNLLYSACDNGTVRLWDVNMGKIISNYNTGEPNKVGSCELQSIDQALPTSLSCSQGGSILAVGFTDEVIRIFDVRVRNKKQK